MAKTVFLITNALFILQVLLLPPAVKAVVKAVEADPQVILLSQAAVVVLLCKCNSRPGLLTIEVKQLTEKQLHVSFCSFSLFKTGSGGVLSIDAIKVVFNCQYFECRRR